MPLLELDQASIDLDYRLQDAITKADGRVFTSGTQALVRMTIMQRLADRRDGIRSAGFVSGYRGSPLGGPLAAGSSAPDLSSAGPNSERSR